jgi:hypothetical protein
MQAIYYAGGMPFRDEIIQAFAVEVNEHNEQTGEDSLIHALGTLKIDGAVTLFRNKNGADDPDSIANILFTDKDIIDLRGWELFSVQSIDEFNSRKNDNIEHPGYIDDSNIDENY